MAVLLWYRQGLRAGLSQGSPHSPPKKQDAERSGLLDNKKINKGKGIGYASFSMGSSHTTQLGNYLAYDAALCTPDQAARMSHRATAGEVRQALWTGNHQIEGS